MLGDICFGPIYGESHFKLLSHIHDTVNRWHELAKLCSHRCNMYVVQLKLGTFECLSISHSVLEAGPLLLYCKAVTASRMLTTMCCDLSSPMSDQPFSLVVSDHNQLQNTAQGW
jgi:hypothetical protein